MRKGMKATIAGMFFGAGTIVPLVLTASPNELPRQIPVRVQHHYWVGDSSCPDTHTHAECRAAFPNEGR